MSDNNDESYRELMKALLQLTMCEAKLGNRKALLYTQSDKFKELCKKLDLEFDIYKPLKIK